MTVTKFSTHENTPGPRPSLSLDVIKAATNRRKKAAIGAGPPRCPIKGFPSQNFVESATVPSQMLTARHVEDKVEFSGAKGPMTYNGGCSGEMWSSFTGNPFRAPGTPYWKEDTKVELPRVVRPIVVAKDETEHGNTVAEPQSYVSKGGFKTNCARRAYAPRQRSLLGLNEMDIRPATSPRISRPKAHKLRHTLPIEVMHMAEPLRSARHGNWKYHLAVWTMQRQAAQQDAEMPR